MRQKQLRSREGEVGKAFNAEGAECAEIGGAEVTQDDSKIAPSPRQPIQTA